MSTSFDRVRPRTPQPQAIPRRTADAQGKRALFSSAGDQRETKPAAMSVELHCHRCGERSVVGLPQALRLAVPSLHLGLRVRRRDTDLRIGLPWSFLRCPACHRLSWTDASVSL